MEQQLDLDFGRLDRERERLEKQRARLVRATRAENTQRAHTSDWKLFSGWCADSCRKALPATEETVALYATWLIDRGLRISSVRRYVNSIAYLHRMDGRDAPVGQARKVLEGAQRLRRERPAGKAALRVTELRRICRATDPGCPRQVRDRALLVFGFASALRRSNLVALDLADVSFLRVGVLVFVQYEKQDQQGRGRFIGLPQGKHPETCPVRTLRAWLRVRGNAPGPLFNPVLRGGHVALRRMGAVAVCHAVKTAVKRIGLHPGPYSAHSLRAGLVSEAGERGATEMTIARHTGHRSMAALRCYFRGRDPFRGNPCKVVGL